MLEILSVCLGIHFQVIFITYSIFDQKKRNQWRNQLTMGDPPGNQSLAEQHKTLDHRVTQTTPYVNNPCCQHKKQIFFNPYLTFFKLSTKLLSNRDVEIGLG